MLYKITYSILKCSLPILIYFCYSQYLFAQPFTCYTVDSTISDPYNGRAKLDTIHVVVVYFDFPNGRLPGNNIPLTDNDLNYLRMQWPKYDTNLEAVSRFGVIKDDSIYKQKAMKYTFQDAWEREFSIGSYYGSAHPDYYDFDTNDVNGISAFLN